MVARALVVVSAVIHDIVLTTSEAAVDQQVAAIEGEYDLGEVAEPSPLAAERMIMLAQKLNLSPQHRAAVSRLAGFNQLTGFNDQQQTSESSAHGGAALQLIRAAQSVAEGHPADLGESLQSLLPIPTKSKKPLDIETVVAAINKLAQKITEEGEEDKRRHLEEQAQCRSEHLALEASMATKESSIEEAKRLARQKREEKRACGVERIASVRRERDIEQTIADIRALRHRKMEEFFQRRKKRRNDILVPHQAAPSICPFLTLTLSHTLHQAVSLVCTFQAFIADRRCKLHKIAGAVVMPTKTGRVTDKSDAKLAEEYRKALEDHAVQWGETVPKDVALAIAGKVSEADQPHQMMSLLQLGDSAGGLARAAVTACVQGQALRQCCTPTSKRLSVLAMACVTARQGNVDAIMGTWAPPVPSNSAQMIAVGKGSATTCQADACAGQVIRGGAASSWLVRGVVAALQVGHVTETAGAVSAMKGARGPF